MGKKISATLITLNEEKNIAAAIKSLHWVDEIIVVDAFSSDNTVEIAKKLGAKVYTNSWSGYGQQKNFAHSKATHPWVLNIDADERVTQILATEIKEIMQNPTSVDGYYISRKTFFLGKWIKFGGWFPNYTLRLSKRSCSSWTEPHIHETLTVNGITKKLSASLYHYTFTDINDQVLTNLKYSQFGYKTLLSKKVKPSLVNLILKPIGKFFETYFLKRGFLDGIPGFIISVNASYSMFLKYSYYYEETKRK